MSYLSNFHHQITGPEKGRKWVFLHGLMGYAQNWRKITASLESTERILAYDQRGHGRSFKPETGYAPEDYAEDLNKITNELGWDRFILVGHSMGARNAMSFTHRYPEKVEKLVIEDMGPELNGASFDYYKTLIENIPTPFKDRDAAKNFFQDRFPQMMEFNEPAPVLSSFLYANLLTNSDGSMDWRFSKAGVLESVRQGHLKERWADVASFRCPTLLIRGGQSRILTHEVFEKMLAINPLIQGIEVPGAGHWIHSDNAPEFLRLITDFANDQLKI